MKTKLLTLAIIATSAGAIAIAKPGKGGPMGERPNPEDIVVELVADYDVNNDNALDQAELANGLVGMHEKRMAKMQEIREQRESEGGPARPRGGFGERDRRGPEPSKIAGHMLVEFDADESGSLDTEELMAAVESMHDRKGRRGPGGPRGPRPDFDAEDSIE
ncbi:MAG: hypothetical protein AAGB46_04210 [Verrucomicrobiota bacterium]